VTDVEDLRRENDALRRRNEQLVHQVADAQQAVEALARGEVDAVTVGASATPLLVHEAQERLRDDRRRDRRALVDAEERFRLLFEEAPVGMLMMSAGGRIALVNARIETLFGYPREELLGEPIEMLIPLRLGGQPPQYREGFLADPRIRAMGEGRDVSGLRKDGSEVAVEIGLSPITTAEGAFVLGSVVDISERKRAEAAQRQIVAVVESAADAIITRDLDGVIRSWNPGATRMLGYRADEMVGRTAIGFIPEDRSAEESRVLARVVAGEQALPFETVRRKRDGSLVEVSITMSPIRDRHGRVVATSIIKRDITARNRAERERVALVEQLQELNADLEGRVRSRTTELSTTLRERESLLREKTSLLQEVHHRVKNNLQTISSLLNLQAKQIKDAESRAFFRETQDRVRSIALLHESLYQSEDLGRVDMQEYIDKLVSTLTRTYGQSARVVAEIDQVRLPADLAIPCGLIVNELITNALKHAFPDTRDVGSNEIRIGMRRVDDDLELVVADNGTGVGNADDLARAETMGLTLVRDLSAQLRGRAEFDSADGARCTVRFPAPSDGGRP
jgi:PAS domain S-box-containing protein